MQLRGQLQNRRLRELMGHCDEVSTAKIQAQLAQLLAEFPDPRVLIDKLLDLRDGKLPI